MVFKVFELSWSWLYQRHVDSNLDSIMDKRLPEYNPKGFQQELVLRPVDDSDSNVIKEIIMYLYIAICNYEFPSFFQYMSEFVQSQLLSRRLAHHCCRRIAVMINDSGCVSPRTQSPMVTNGTNG